MTHHEYTASITVHEDWLETDKDIKYDTVVLVEAEDIEQAEQKIIDFFESKDILTKLEHKVIIHKILPKIH